MGNQLYYGDNLDVLRNNIATESVDLIYLDPPFNSSASYNVLFKAPSGAQSPAQIEAFDDTWHWNESAERAFDEVLKGSGSEAAIMLRAMRSALGENDMMAYLAMMAVRLIELHRVLKPTGSLYLHCDPTASHYLKALLDGIFSPAFFQNEIVWKRTTTHSDSKTWSRVSDSIFFYTKGKTFTWNTPREAHSEDYLSSKYRYDDDDGRGRYMLDNMLSPNYRPRMVYEWRGFPSPSIGWRYQKERMAQLDEEGRIWYPRKKDGALDLAKRPRLKRYLREMEGGVIGTVWTDIPPINSQAQERLGYPTQKPIVLLERIISASSNKGDVVLDPFCGCGTTVHAAQKLKRQWIGIDITHLAIALIERRLKEAFPKIKYDVHGVPKDADAARDLAERDKHEFQKWIVASVGGQPYKGGKKGMDRGIDGYLRFRDDKNAPQLAVISVKGGGIKSGDVRDLNGTMDRESAPLGVFLTLKVPTREMEKEAASAGFFESGGQKFPRVQILTAAEVIEGKRPRVPFGHTESLKKAQREDDTKQQGELF
jgi:site-specific DNA-methyltransferase (adenine-specific)